MPLKGEYRNSVRITMSSHLTYRIASTLQIPTAGDPTVLSISLEGTFIAVGSADGHVFVWCLRTYKLLCQTSPPLDGYGATDTGVTNMTWMPNGLLVFSRKNGLMGILHVGKVRNLPERMKICSLLSSQHFIEAVSLAVHDRLPVLAMAYSNTLKSWATASHNEINFIRWKRSDCKLSPVNCKISSESRFQGHTFYTSPGDRIVAKRVVLSSEEERAVTVTSLNWIKKSSNVAHLLVAFLHHHVECVR